MSITNIDTANEYRSQIKLSILERYTKQNIIENERLFARNVVKFIYLCNKSKIEISFYNVCYLSIKT